MVSRFMTVAHLAFSVADLKKNYVIFIENIQAKLCIKLAQLFHSLSYGHT